VIVFEIQNTHKLEVIQYTVLVNVLIGFEQHKCFEHVRQFVAFRLGLWLYLRVIVLVLVRLGRRQSNMPFYTSQHL